MAMMAVKVARAAGTTGFLKACTPLLTASTPVKAVHPEAKALTRIQASTSCTVGVWPVCCGASEVTASGCPPDKQICGSDECGSRLLYAAEIDHGQDCEYE